MIVKVGVPATGEDIYKEIVHKERTCGDCATIYLPEMQDIVLERYANGTRYMAVVCPVCGYRQWDCSHEELLDFQWERLAAYQDDLGFLPKKGLKWRMR